MNPRKGVGDMKRRNQRKRTGAAAAVLLATGAAVAMGVAGCKSSQPPPAAPPRPVVSAPVPAPVQNSAPSQAAGTAFSPYVAARELPPPPPAIRHKHQKLRLVRRDRRVYLEDPEGRYYPAGRD